MLEVSSIARRRHSDLFDANVFVLSGCRVFSHVLPGVRARHQDGGAAKTVSCDGQRSTGNDALVNTRARTCSVLVGYRHWRRYRDGVSISILSRYGANTYRDAIAACTNRGIGRTLDNKRLGGTASHREVQTRDGHGAGRCVRSARLSDLRIAIEQCTTRHYVVSACNSEGGATSQSASSRQTNGSYNRVRLRARREDKARYWNHLRVLHNRAGAWS